MQVSQLVCLGLNHHTATVELREHFSHIRLIGDGRINDDNAILRELVTLSTCNRVEFYAYVNPHIEDPHAALIELLSTQMESASCLEHLYFYRGQAVVEHLGRVAAGLDSLVLGEPQILGQINNACQLAQQNKTMGPVLSLLFRTAVQAGKRARTETKISSNPASVSSVALALAQKITGNLRAQRVLLIGLGEIGNLTLKLLKARGVTQLAIANRTQQKAATIAAEWGGRAYSLDELPQALLAADVVISATRAPQPLLDAITVRTVMEQRQNERLVLVDLAVPRDIDPAAGDITGVCLFDVDDLQNGVDEAFLARQREIPGVEAIIAEEVTAWARKFEELTVEPLVATLRQRAETIRQRELARTLRNLGDVDAQTLAQLQHFSRALVNQLLHEPTVQLKKKAGQPAADEYACAIRDLFGLTESSEG
jgi:glutamyl-tRNA reductase